MSEPTPKPFSGFIKIEMADFTFDQPKEVFLGAFNLELAISAKGLRELMIAEYDRRNPPVEDAMYGNLEL